MLTKFRAHLGIAEARAVQLKRDREVMEKSRKDVAEKKRLQEEEEIRVLQVLEYSHCLLTLLAHLSL